MQLRNIEYVLSIAETGSFSQAAKHLHISQPALSQAIQRLEEELGAKLFVRKNKETSLTRAGDLFLEDAKKILMLSNQIKKKMNDIQNLEDGEISLGISLYDGQMYFSNLLLEFKKIYPNIKMTILEDFSVTLERKLMMGHLDFAMFTTPIESDELLCEHLFFEEILLATPPKHPIRDSTPSFSDRFGSVKLSSFDKEDFVLIKQGHRFRIITDALFQQSGIKPHVVFESRSNNTIQSFITGGIGSGFITTTQQRHTLARWQSAYYHLEDVDAKREHVIAYNRDGYLSSASKAFIDLAKKLCKQQFTYHGDLCIVSSC